MLYKIEWCENKSMDWKVVTLSTGGQQFENVSVNRINKKDSKVFPGFDEIQAGRDVEGELWTSSTGKHYLFPPKVGMGTKPAWAKKAGDITKAMETKQANITASMDRKELSILLSSVQRDATLLTTTALSGRNPSRQELAQEWNYWKSWLLENHPTESDLSEVEAGQAIPS